MILFLQRMISYISTGIESEDPRRCWYYQSGGYILQKSPYRSGDFWIRTELLQKGPRKEIEKINQVL
jgi:hypothetical protein